MFSELVGVFPAGLVPGVCRAAKRDKIEVRLLDCRERAPKPDPDVDVSWLYDYQRAALRACIKKTRGIVWAPTGSGKTEIFCALARSIDCDWLFVADTIDLVQQAADRYEKRTGEQCGVVGDGQWSTARVTCATLQTLHKRADDPRTKELLRKVGGLVCDEMHVMPANTYYGVAQKAVNAFYRVGLSATPLARGDRRTVFAVATLGPVIYRIHPDTLIKAGRLARPKIRMIPVFQPSSATTWQGSYTSCIVNSQERNAAIVEAVRRCEKPALVFVKILKHGKKLAEEIEKSGAHEYGSVEFVWGKWNAAAREAARARLERGDTSVVVVNVVWQKGIDIPDLRSVVVACGGTSVIAALQRIGRGMRVTPGKTEFEVWDFLDEGNKWTHRHALSRRRAYLSEGFEVTEARELRRVAKLKRGQVRGDENPLASMIDDFK
jgi:superfamily II DNA or RNA helicase